MRHITNDSKWSKFGVHWQQFSALIGDRPLTAMILPLIGDIYNIFKISATVYACFVDWVARIGCPNLSLINIFFRNPGSCYQETINSIIIDLQMSNTLLIILLWITLHFKMRHCKESDTVRTDHHSGVS